MTALASKPGLTNTSVLAIPKDWNPAWFRGLIASQLKGADVRNAVGANGVTISGTLASPYATVGLASPIAPSGSTGIRFFTQVANFVDAGSATPASPGGPVGYATQDSSSANTGHIALQILSNFSNTSGLTNAQDAWGEIGWGTGVGRSMSTSGSSMGINIPLGEGANVGLFIAKAGLLRFRFVSHSTAGLVLADPVWAGNAASMQFGNCGLLAGPDSSGASAKLMSNLNSTGNGTYAYMTSTFGTLYEQNAGPGDHVFYGAVSGTAGNAATVVQTAVLLTGGGLTIAAPTLANTALTISNKAGSLALQVTGNAAGTAVMRFNTQATTGATTPVAFSANKPGLSTNTITWLPVNIDGTVRYIPCWS